MLILRLILISVILFKIVVFLMFCLYIGEPKSAWLWQINTQCFIYQQIKKFY